MHWQVLLGGHGKTTEWPHSGWPATELEVTVTVTVSAAGVGGFAILMMIRRRLGLPGQPGSASLSALGPTVTSWHCQAISLSEGRGGLIGPGRHHRLAAAGGETAAGLTVRGHRIFRNITENVRLRLINLHINESLYAYIYIISNVVRLLSNL